MIDPSSTGSANVPMFQPKTMRTPAITPLRVNGSKTRRSVCHGLAPRQAAASSSFGSTLLSAAPMLMTMNGNVKIDIANTTDGRLKSSDVPEMLKTSKSGESGPPGSRTVLIPNVT